MGRIVHIVCVASSSVALMLPHCEASDKLFYLSKPQLYSRNNGGDVNINDSIKDPLKQSMCDYFLPTIEVRHAMLEKESRKRSKEEKLQRKNDQEGSCTLVGEKDKRY